MENPTGSPIKITDAHDPDRKVEQEMMIQDSIVDERAGDQIILPAKFG